MRRMHLTLAVVAVLMALPLLMPLSMGLESDSLLIADANRPAELSDPTTLVGNQHSDGRIGVSAFDPFKTPEILRGSSEEWASDIFVDGSGFVYVTGYTKSGDFPTTPGAYRETHRGTSFYDVFVTKYAPNGSVVYSTLIGGEFTDVSWSIRAFDGEAYVVGYTENASDPWPTTTGAVNESSNGNYDVFLTKFNSSGTGLEYSTLLGGFGDDFGYQLELSSDGVVAYICGQSESTATYPATPGAFNSTMWGSSDAFLMVVDIESSTLNYSTVIGGEDYDESRDLTIVSESPTEKIIGISGLTDSVQFPTTAGAYDSLISGRSAFLFELNVTNWTTSVQEYGTFLGGGQGTGGAEYEFPALDYDGTDYAIALSTPGSEFPISAGAAQTAPLGGSYSGYVCKFRSIPGGDALRFGSYLSGSSTDHIIDVVFDDARDDPHMIVTGSTQSADFPLIGLRSNSLVGTRDSFLAVIGPVVSWSAVLNLSSTHHQDSSEMVAVYPTANGDAVTFGHSTTAGATEQDCFTIDWTIPDAPRVRLVSFRNVTEANSTFEARVQAEASNSLAGSEIEKVTLEVFPEGNPDDRRTDNSTSPVSGTDDVYSTSLKIPAEWEGLRLEWNVYAYSEDYGRASVNEDLEIEGIPWEGEEGAPWVPPIFSLWSAYIIAVAFIIAVLLFTILTGVVSPKAAVWIIPGYVFTALGIGLGGFLSFGVATTLFPLLNVVATVAFTIVWATQATRHAINPKFKMNRWRWLMWGGAIGTGILAFWMAYQLSTAILTNVWFWTFTVSTVVLGLAGFGRKRLSRIKLRGFSLEYVVWIASIAVSVLTALSLLGFLPF